MYFILAPVVFSLKAQLISLQVVHNWQLCEFSGVYVCVNKCVCVCVCVVDAAWALDLDDKVLKHQDM